MMVDGSHVIDNLQMAIVVVMWAANNQYEDLELV